MQENHEKAISPTPIPAENRTSGKSQATSNQSTSHSPSLVRDGGPAPEELNNVNHDNATREMDSTRLRQPLDGSAKTDEPLQPDASLPRPPELDRPLSDIYGDELYIPNFNFPSPYWPTQASVSRPNGLFEQRLQAANDRSLKAYDLPSRTPFKDGSPLAATSQKPSTWDANGQGIAVSPEGTGTETQDQTYAHILLGLHNSAYQEPVQPHSLLDRGPTSESVANNGSDDNTEPPLPPPRFVPFGGPRPDPNFPMPWSGASESPRREGHRLSSFSGYSVESVRVQHRVSHPTLKNKTQTHEDAGNAVPSISGADMAEDLSAAEDSSEVDWVIYPATPLSMHSP